MGIYISDKKLVIITSPKTNCYYLPIEVNKSLQHEIKFIMSHNESLAENVTKKEISQLLLKYKHGNDIRNIKSRSLNVSMEKSLVLY